ncbi:hypothetical protein [Actinomyces ruminicola]|uniref:hypothetical protein n=1 Tax=Actinomyces ruminicola TaxID=332524 RepID=UPI0011C756F7|nr:hypothetical protein [Actinomyces ruminicola]
MIEIDLEELLSSSRLPRSTPLTVAVTWRSMPSYMCGTVARVSLATSGRHVIKAVLPGEQVGGNMTIRTTVSLAADLAGLPPGVACRAGSVLIEDAVSVILEGSGSRFPVTVEDFSECAWDSDASWHLSIVDEDLRSPFLTSCWLSINSRDRELVEAITAQRPDGRQEALLEEVFHNVTILMLEAGEVGEKMFLLSQQSWPPGTLGAVLASHVDPAMRSDYSDLGELTSLSMLASEASRRDGTARRMGMGRPFI